MEKFCLEDNNFGINVRETFKQLREDERLFDVTLATDDGQHIQAHKIILSAGSNFFSDIFMKKTHHDNSVHMIVYLKGIKSDELQHVTEFLYSGQTSILEEDLKHFLETGRELGVKGLQSELYDNQTDRDPEYPPYPSQDYEGTHSELENDDEMNVIASGSVDLLDAYADTATIDTSDDTVFVKTEEIEQQLSMDEDLDKKIEQIIAKSGNDWICNVCGKTRSKKQHIKYHAETHMEGVNTCPLCGKTFSTRKYLQQHVSNVHSELYTCDFCGKSDMTRSLKYKHKCPKQGFFLQN